MSRRPGRRNVGRARLRPLAVLIVAALAGAVVLSTSQSAAAATTRPAQLALTGVVTPQHPTGGSVVGANPGDSVVFTASTVPTAGLDQLGLSLGSLTGGLLNSLAGYSVKVSFGSTFPGGARTVVLGPANACGGVASTTVTFPVVGTYGFTWSALAVQPLGGLLGGSSCQTVALNGNELKSKGVALNATNQYVGAVSVSTAPPSTGIGVQLPGVSVAPSVTGVGQLPTVGVPGATLNVPVTVPSLPGVSLLPSGSTHSSGAGGKATTPGPSGFRIHYTPMGVPVPATVVPQGYGCCYVAPAGTGVAAQDASDNAVTGAGGTGATPSGARRSGAATSGGATGSGQPVDLAASRTSSAGLPLVLSVLAIVALSLVTFMYARLFLTRRAD